MSEPLKLFSGLGLKGAGPDLKSSLATLEAADNPLLNWSLEDFVLFFDHVSREMISVNSPIASLIRDHDLGFLIAWMKAGSIKGMLDNQLSQTKSVKGEFSRAVLPWPRGIAVHWIAGNVPVLGIISLMQGLLSRNKNIVKASKSFGDVLDAILKYISTLSVYNGDRELQGSELLHCSLIIYLERSDIKSQTELSKSADVRVAWGGMEAVTSISSLPSKIDCKDLVFGPKVSFAILTESALDELDTKELLDIADGLSRDIFTFGQAGCNAPHNLILIGDHRRFDEFINLFGAAMTKEAKRNPTRTFQPIDCYNVLQKRFIFRVGNQKRVIEGPEFSYTIFVSEDEAEIQNPLYCHTIQVSNVKKLDDLTDLFPDNPQTVGLVCGQAEKKKFIDKLFSLGVLRITRMGQMALYTQPWDGYFPIHEMVKWVSVEQ